MERTKDTKLNHVLTSGVCNGLILGSPKLEKASAQNVEGIVVVKAKGSAREYHRLYSQGALFAGG